MLLMCKLGAKETGGYQRAWTDLPRVESVIKENIIDSNEMTTG